MHFAAAGGCIVLGLCRFILSNFPLVASKLFSNAHEKHYLLNAEEGRPLALGDSDSDENVEILRNEPSESHEKRPVLQRLIRASAMTLVFVSAFMRPVNSAFRAMSWTPPLLPIVDFLRTSDGVVGGMMTQHDITGLLANKTFLEEPIPLSRLPLEANLSGFEDWYAPGSQHYSSFADPLHISNLGDEPLTALQSSLKDLEIRHVLLIFLESQRQDVFPSSEQASTGTV